MSAYSASTPVTASATDPRLKKAMVGWAAKKARAWVGDRAASTPGAPRMPRSPKEPRVRNQIAMIGPNQLPTRAVPSR
jgi:hypothetical protein